ncbi:PqqD family protein [Bradyrhizobium sp. HKCCYLR20261]|uniref:PqqD family protein n=1 Tax=Bradyrhizobium sp. HKCCYLR20261 TaxID=3420760 RepID=UPI003EBF6506
MSDSVVRADDLEVHEVPDGYIVYQGTRDRVHYLNKTAAIIFEFCDGLRPVDEIVSRVARAFELGTSAHQEIRAGLESLKNEGLVQSPST